MAWWNRTAEPTGGPPPSRADRVTALAARHAEALAVLDGDPARAVALLTPTVVTCRALRGADHPDTLVVEGNLAVATVHAGRREEGLELLRACVADRTRVLGGDDPRTHDAHDALGAALRLAGRSREAIAEAALALDGRRRVLGPTHPDTLVALTGLGLARAAAGDLADAAALLDRALRHLEAADARGPAVVVRAELARVHAAMGRGAEAGAGLARAAADAAALLGPDHPDSRALAEELRPADAAA